MINPYEHDDRPMGAPDDDSCRLGISRHCTEEGSYLWEGEPCCHFCLALAEESKERAEARELSADMDLWVRR